MKWFVFDLKLWCGTASYGMHVPVFFPSEHDLGEDDIYDCVPCEDDGDDIYEDIIKVEVRQPMVRALWCHLMSGDRLILNCADSVQEL